MADRLNLAVFLPLTPVSFETLLALAGGEQHGYAVMLNVERRTRGAVSLHAGSLYRALNRLLDAGLIEELEERPDPEHDDERRRYYRVTAKGLRWPAPGAPAGTAGRGRSRPPGCCAEGPRDRYE